MDETGSGQPEIKINDRLLIRLCHPFLSPEGGLDEIITTDKFGDCEFHLERMDQFSWWMRFYSTRGRVLPREVVVWLGPEGGSYELEQPDSHEDEKHQPEECHTPEETIALQIDYFIRYFGVEGMLKRMITNIRSIDEEENHLVPSKTASHLTKLAVDLEAVLQNYQRR